jgi:hypothetical protein
MFLIDFLLWEVKTLIAAVTGSEAYAIRAIFEGITLAVRCGDLCCGAGSETRRGRSLLLGGTQRRGPEKVEHNE